MNAESMRIKSITTIFLLSGFLFSCKKDALVGEYEIFQGNWEWTFSKETIFDPLVQITTHSTVYSSELPDTYGLEFLKKGKVRFFKNGKNTEKYRTVIDTYSEGSSNGLVGGSFFIILLDNKPERSMVGYISQDTLQLISNYFPIENYSQGEIHHSFENFFVRQ